MNPSPDTLTDRIRRLTARITAGAGSAVHRLGVHPDAITIAGLLVVGIAAVPIAQGQHPLGALILLLGLPLDALDGAVARAMQRKDRFGAVLDSTLDRYADGIIFAALAYWFATQDQFVYLLLTLAALNGSFVVSYVRARAGEADLSVKVGWFSRLERVAVLLVMLAVPALLVPGLVVLAIGTNISALQRLWYVRRHLDT
ncbi:MAG: CDP-alcohol phosphatidyltransferase family protein [Chloroflexota bacterium]|nr:CDP-alcohol phosphatidyltransferase family protein [Chloroflexota bacterium]